MAAGGLKGLVSGALLTEARRTQKHGRGEIRDSGAQRRCDEGASE
ncbi:hypothetical protein, partial [Salmonella enterica]